jgi:hypothetical protein
MKEQDLFVYLKENCYPDLIKSKESMSRWDCYSLASYARIELKCRKVHYDELILEKKKYDAMVSKCQYDLDIPYYINWTPKGIYRWNLYKINPSWSKRFLKATTEFDNNELINKDVTYLNINNAEIL